MSRTLEAGSVGSLQGRRMTLIRHIGLDHIAWQYLIELCTSIDMNLMLFTIVVLYGVIHSLNIPQGAFHRIFGLALLDGGTGFLFSQGIFCVTNANSGAQESCHHH
jgi:hypothetical protein